MTNKRSRAYLITIGAGLVAAALVALRQGFFSPESSAEALRALCDAFFVPGALMVCFGLFAFVAQDGFFNIFSYAVYCLKRRFMPFSKKEGLHYYEYCVAKAEKRHKPTYCVLKVGLLFLALAVAFLLLYERAA